MSKYTFKVVIEETGETDCLTQTEWKEEIVRLIADELYPDSVEVFILGEN